MRWKFHNRPRNASASMLNARGWLTEANDFIWPGPDLWPAISGDPASVAYGMLPPGFMKVLRERLAQRWRAKRASVTRRTE
jgi:hypothetical protein